MFFLVKKKKNDKKKYNGFKEILIISDTNYQFCMVTHLKIDYQIYGILIRFIFNCTKSHVFYPKIFNCTKITRFLYPKI